MRGGSVEIFQVVGVGVVSTILIVVIRQRQPEMALLLSLLVGVLLFLFLVNKIAVIIDILQQLASQAEIKMEYLNVILKIIGVAYLAEFGAQICRDAGEGAIAAKVELAGKVIIMMMAFPVMMMLLETIMRLLP